MFDILKREQVPATIFVSGRWVDTHPEAMVDLTGDPLIEFGDHSYDHPHMTKLPAERVGEQIDQTEAALGRYGRRSVAFRPPFGDWNRRVIEIVHGQNLPTVTWDVVSGDPSAQTTTAAHDPRGPRPCARRIDHHLSHQRARLENPRGASGDPERTARARAFGSFRSRS